MIRETFPVGLFQCNCTILGDEVSHEAVVVDPGDELPQILQRLARHSLTVKQILITHAHIDHVMAAQRLKEITGAPIFYNQHDLPLVAIMDEQATWLDIATPDVRPPDADLADAQTFRFGAIAGHAIHTPGHTQGSVCLYLPDQHLLLAGDTLFAGSVGRTDLPGGNGRQLIHSIQEKLMTLPEETLVIPGHGRATSIAREREQNPFLQ